jgi:hypothetical protein
MPTIGISKLTVKPGSKFAVQPQITDISLSNDSEVRSSLAARGVDPSRVPTVGFSHHAKDADGC